MMKRNILALGTVVSLALVTPALADTAYQTLPFSQNWSNIGLITVNDDWSGVPGITGYRGDNLTAVTAVDPQTVLSEGTPVVNVIANQTNPDTQSSGGVAEFEITDPVVAFQGSGTADAPNLVLYINATGQSNVNVSYNLRDIDGSVADVVQPVALQYRVGGSGDFVNVPAGFVADASSGPSLATLVTPVSVTLPAAANNQSQLQIRILTTNAPGADGDEWIGVDDISVTAGAAPTPTLDVDKTTLNSFGNVWPVPGTSALKTFTVSGSNLTAPIQVSAPPAGFESKLSSSGTWGTGTISVSPVSGTVAATGVDVRMAPASAGQYSATFTVSTTGAPNKSVAAYGSAVNPATTFVYDDFDYTAGNLTDVQANWLQFQAAAGAGPFVQVEAGNLAFPGLARAASQGNVLKAVGAADNGQGVVLPFPGVAGGDVYYSFLLNIPVGTSNVSASKPILTAFREGTGTFVRGSVLLTAGLPGKTRLALSFFSATAGPSISPTDLNEGETYLVVVKYSFNGDLDDEAKLFLVKATDPFPATEPAVSELTYTKQGSESDLDNFLTGVVVRQQNFGNPWTAQVDAVRAGGTWASVTPSAASVADWQLF